MLLNNDVWKQLPSIRKLKQNTNFDNYGSYYHFYKGLAILEFWVLRSRQSATTQYRQHRAKAEMQNFFHLKKLTEDIHGEFSSHPGKIL